MRHLICVLVLAAACDADDKAAVERTTDKTVEAMREGAVYAKNKTKEAASDPILPLATDQSLQPLPAIDPQIASRGVTPMSAVLGQSDPRRNAGRVSELGPALTGQ